MQNHIDVDPIFAIQHTEEIMAEPINHQEEEKETLTFMDHLIAIYRRFNLFAAINEGDHWTIMIGKIIVRIIGLIFLLLLSPFLFLGLTIAFLLAG